MVTNGLVVAICYKCTIIEFLQAKLTKIKKYDSSKLAKFGKKRLSPDLIYE
jgi:hypothetical protein